MEFIKITHENLENEHICCALSGAEAQSKKDWLKDRLSEGLVFLKSIERGKCFIEYIPAEYAWVPIDAKDYMYIDCLWVSGKFKGHGYSNQLFDACITDSKAKGKKGLVILSAKKKMGFLADPKYLRYKGFVLADTAEPYFELMYLPFDKSAEQPKFKEQVKQRNVKDVGFSLYYTNQCPFTAKYVPIIEGIAKDCGVEFRSIHLATAQLAQSAPSPFTTYSLFYNGEFVTHEILSDKKFLKLVEELCQ